MHGVYGGFVEFNDEYKAYDYAALLVRDGASPVEVYEMTFVYNAPKPKVYIEEVDNG